MERTLLAIALFAAGCGAKQTPEPREPLIAISLTAEGLQPFPDGEVTQASLEAAFPGYNVAANGESFAVRDGGNTVLYIETRGDMVNVKVRDASVVGPSNVHVGADYATLAGLPELQCRRGGAPLNETAFCTAATLPNIIFAVDMEGVETPGCVDSCELVNPGVLAGKKVTSMDWQP